jgi:hypothetical protein
MPVDSEGGGESGVEEPGSIDASGIKEVPSGSAEELHAPAEDVQEVRGIKAPPMPTQEEIDLHRVTHLPYRSWCAECVEAFAREWAHRQKDVARTIPLVSCDYLYATKNGVFARDELSEEERRGAARVLVMYCSASKTPFADGVPQKGLDQDGYAIECMKQNVLWLGHSRVTLRADNEPALAALVDRATAALKMAGVENVVDEGSVPYDPQTNGAAENAVRLVKGMFKVLLLGLERELEARVPLDHPIASWLFKHGAYLRALQVKGEDGKTAHQRVRGSSGPQRLLAFGELTRYKCRAQEKGIGGTRWRFSTGVWLGVERRTGQFVVYDKSMGGIRHARTLMPMPKP